MTKEEFIDILEARDYRYQISGNEITIDRGRNIILDGLTSIPPNVDFRNSGCVDLTSLVNLPSSTQFNNKGGLSLDSLTEIPIGFEFNNGTYLVLTRLKRLSPGITFNNTGAIQFESLESISPDFVFGGPEYFYLGPFIEEFLHYWDGNIEGVHPKRLLNKMISLGLFDKDKK
jgi:hypothetical protein